MCDRSCVAPLVQRQPSLATCKTLHCNTQQPPLPPPPPPPDTLAPGADPPLFLGAGGVRIFRIRNDLLCGEGFCPRFFNPPLPY